VGGEDVCVDVCVCCVCVCVCVCVYWWLVSLTATQRHAPLPNLRVIPGLQSRDIRRQAAGLDRLRIARGVELGAEEDAVPVVCVVVGGWWWVVG
jgi:capsular polysaccharide biosynthesis protein